MTRTSKLEAWLRRHIYTERDELRCTRFVLHHLGAAGKVGSEVITISSDIKDELIGNEAEEIFDAASGDASGLGSTQSYVVLAYYGKEKKSNGRFTFRARADEEDEDSVDMAGNSEPPTTIGLVAQTMRHNEAIMRTSTQSMGAAFTSLQVMIQRQAEVVDNLLGERFNTIELIEALTTRKHERELELLEEERKRETQKELLAKFSPLIPIVANKLAGKKMLPAADPQTLMLAEFFKTLTPQQLEGLQAVLSPEQLMTVLSLAQEFVGEKSPTTETGISYADKGD